MTQSYQHISLEQAPGQPAPPPPGNRYARANFLLLYFVAAVLLVWLLSGFYQVKADEVAIVERLGRYLATPDGKAIQIEQGLHYHLPYPIDTVHKISIQQTASLRVNTFDSSPAAYADFKMALQRDGLPNQVISALFDPYLITADKSVIHMDISVVYRINDPEAWLNTVSHSSLGINNAGDLRQEVFQEMAQHAMISQVSHMTLEQVLFSDLGQLGTTMQTAVEKAMQLRSSATSPAAKSLGIQILRVEIVRSRPPERVQSAFDQVIQAKAELQARMSTAKANYNAARTKAEGQRDTMVTEADQYATAQKNAASGEAARFSEVYAQYKNSPETTRFNIFVEAAQRITSNARRIFIAQPGQKTFITVDPPQYDANQVAPKPPGG